VTNSTDEPPARAALAGKDSHRHKTLSTQYVLLRQDLNRITIMAAHSSTPTALTPKTVKRPFILDVFPDTPLATIFRPLL
jgi:hypothetical protein